MLSRTIQKLGLGTVQFGLDYGISNKDGQTSAAEVKEILDLAKVKDIQVIDTARLYGNSEEVIGQCLDQHADFKIVTKTISLRRKSIGEEDLVAFEKGVEDSFSHLQVRSLYGLIAHHADDLLVEGGEALYETMQGFKDHGKVTKVGASIYNAAQIDALLDRYELDLVQLPLNIFDQRLIHSGRLEKLKEAGAEIHVRSAFLQGVVFMQPDALPEHLKGLHPQLEALGDLATEYETSTQAIALAFVMNCEHIDQVICGVNNAAQLAELCDLAENLPDIDPQQLEKLRVSDERLVNPALWQ